jgi:hypothetical protein
VSGAQPDDELLSRDDDQPLTREAEDDYDLLTFGEAGARLDHEIRVQRARLASLRDAAARNARQPITDENFTKFFGYEGRARRNTE